MPLGIISFSGASLNVNITGQVTRTSDSQHRALVRVDMGVDTDIKSLLVSYDNGDVSSRSQTPYDRYCEVRSE